MPKNDGTPGGAEEKTLDQKGTPGGASENTPVIDADEFFNKGFGKGAEKARREFLEQLGVEKPEEAAELVKAARKAKEEQMRKAGEFDKLLDETRAEVEKYKPHAERWFSYEKSKREELASLDGLNDEDKEIIASLPLEKAEKYVQRIRQASGKSNPMAGITARPELMTLNEAANAFTEGRIKRAEYDEIRRKALSQP